MVGQTREEFGGGARRGRGKGARSIFSSRQDTAGLNRALCQALNLRLEKETGEVDGGLMKLHARSKAEFKAKEEHCVVERAIKGFA